MLGALKIQLAL